MDRYSDRGPFPLDNGGARLTGPNGIFYPPPFNGMPFNQAVFLQNAGSFVWQAVGGFNAGSYVLSFYLAIWRRHCLFGLPAIQEQFLSDH